MDIFCEKCRKVIGHVADEKVPVGKKASVSCPGCGEKIFFSREERPSNPDFDDTILAPPDPKPSQFRNPGFTPASSAKSVSPDTGYDFAIMDIIREAWQKTSGAKGPLWGAGILVFLIVMGFSILMGVLLGLVGARSESIAISGALQLALTVAMYPFLAGIMMIGIRRAVDLPISYKMAFGYFGFVVPIVIAAFLVSIMTTLGFILLILPGIYLSLAYMLVIPLIVDKKMSAWQAMEASRKAIHKHWFKVFGLYFVMGFIYLLSLIPLGLGIIWTMPMFVVMSGILYREIFGVSEMA
ncbi:MAG: hypothetical protein KKG47_07825 [Proteobacteria bacterium]|nr:hypothetical protein [Pseudomonadota bacterium]MBU1739376.1 hypothetical protein [Pseudomonadota bacterium]